MSRTSSKGKIYDNCKILHPNGTLLSFVNESRIRWFLRRNLATRIDEKTIKLNFEPNLKDKNPRLIFKKENICVKCGSLENLTKHHVVPYCYVKHIDKEIKGRNIFSVVVMCRSCHDSYEDIALNLKKEILDGYDFSRHKEIDNAIKEVISLYRHLDRIPSEKFEKMVNNVERVFDVDLRSSEDLEKILQEFSVKKREHFYGEEIIKRLSDEGKIVDFMNMWRRHFFTHVNPQFMAEGWSYVCDELNIKYCLENSYLRCIS